MSPPLPELATSSPLSSPESFITAEASPRNPLDVTVTDISAPDDDADHGADTEYRKTSRIPTELKQHCQIYLEENLHLMALRILSKLQSSSTVDIAHHQGGRRWTPRAHDDGSSIYCPPPNQLAFLSTIAIHPDLTTRPREEHWKDVSSTALDYLRNLLNTAGPINARFQDAFRFGNIGRRSGGGSPAADGSEPIHSAGGEAPLYGKYGKHSVWRRGQDFFNVVGWAFNCSVLYPNRWEYWRQWLEFMFDVLEADLHERTRIDEQEHAQAGGQEGQCKYSMLADSMLAGYLHKRNSRTEGLRWITRVIFADGQDSSASLFQEVWEKEHKGISRNKTLKKRKRNINFEKGDFGGLLDDDSVYSSQNSEPPTPQKRRTNSNKLESPTLEASYVESIPLRQRLFAMMSYLCYYLPVKSIKLPDLYEMYETQIRSLPLSIFTAFVDSTSSALRVDSQISILQDALGTFMPSSAVDPAKVDAERYDANGISPAILERCYLPYAANTIAIEDNAKVSILLEELIKLVWMIGTEQFSEKFDATVMKGISAREAKIKKKVAAQRGRRGGAIQDDSDLEARALFDQSSERLRQLAGLIMDEADEEDTEMDGTSDKMEEGTREAKVAV